MTKFSSNVALVLGIRQLQKMMCDLNSSGDCRTIPMRRKVPADVLMGVQSGEEDMYIHNLSLKSETLCEKLLSMRSQDIATCNV